MPQKLETLQLTRVVRMPARKNPKPVEQITDRAKRYRAQSVKLGAKECCLCGEAGKLDRMHLDGNESHGEQKNIAYGCRSCNVKLSKAFTAIGAGVRTRQFNAGRKPKWNPATVPTFEQYKWAIQNGQRQYYVRGAGLQAGEHDEAGAIIHATPKRKRIEYARKIAQTRAPRSRSEVPF